MNVLSPLGSIRAFAGMFAIQEECQGVLSLGETNNRPHRMTASSQPAAPDRCRAHGANDGLIGTGAAALPLRVYIDNCYFQAIAQSRIIRITEPVLRPKHGGQEDRWNRSDAGYDLKRQARA
ncbi:MAG TPA: hypothetical protein VN702_03790 [Acetobacteraceae bacterium]|nr:hypothetical protein [Acetobacteraceae bacterium]